MRRFADWVNAMERIRYTESVRVFLCVRAAWLSFGALRGSRRSGLNEVCIPEAHSGSAFSEPVCHWRYPGICRDCRNGASDHEAYRRQRAVSVVAVRAVCHDPASGLSVASAAALENSSVALSI
jgi:hypothetical protein